MVRECALSRCAPVSFVQRGGPMEADSRSPTTLEWLIGIIAAVCVIWLLRTAAIVAIPIVTAFFIAISVYPVLVFLRERLKRFRWAALPLTLVLLVAVVGGAVWILAESVDEAVEAAPQHADRAQEAWDQARSSMTAAGLPVPENLWQTANVQERLTRYGTAAVRLAWDTITGLVLVFFLVLLMLLEGPLWSRNAQRLLRDPAGRTIVDAVGEVATKVRQYLYVRSVLGLMSAAAAGLWLLVLDVDLVLVWVVLTFLLNYIPNVGSVIAVLPPSLMAIVQYGPMYGLLVLGGLTVFEQIIGNYIDPRMQGRRLQISPVIVLASLVFWTWVWGPLGAVLSVPVTLTLLAAAARSERLRPFASLVAAESDEDGDKRHRHAA